MNAKTQKLPLTPRIQFTTTKSKQNLISSTKSRNRIINFIFLKKEQKKKNKRLPKFRKHFSKINPNPLPSSHLATILAMKSSYRIFPSDPTSTSLIHSSNSAGSSFSPMLVRMCRSSVTETKPVASLSSTLKASRS